MSDSPRLPVRSALPARSAVVVLFVVAACALLAAGGLTAAVLADDRPDQAAAGAATDRPSPTARPAATRAAGPPICLIGTWRTVDERMMIKFYTNEDPIPFTVTGRVFEFRPDGTGTERMDNVVHSGAFQGNELRLVGNGSLDFTWTATDRAVHYVERTRSEFTWSYYDQRGLVHTEAVPPNQPWNEWDDYTCQGTQVVESNSKGYRSVWTRTTGSGVYG